LSHLTIHSSLFVYKKKFRTLSQFSIEVSLLEKSKNSRVFFINHSEHNLTFTTWENAS